jgi:hypothetical protein
MRLSMGMNSVIQDYAQAVGHAGNEMDALITETSLDNGLRNLSRRKAWADKLILAHKAYREAVSSVLDEIWEMEFVEDD